MPDFLLLFFFFLRKKNNKTSSSICLPLFEKKVLMSTLAISFHSLEICRYDYFSINIYDVMKFIVISLFSHNTTSSIAMERESDRQIIGHRPEVCTNILSHFKATYHLL